MTLLRSTGAAAANGDSQLLFRRGSSLLLVACTIGFAIGIALHAVDGSYFREAFYGRLMTVSLYRDQDAVWLAFCLLFSIYLCWSLRRGGDPRRLSALSVIWPENPPVWRYSLAITSLVLGFTGLGAYLFHHSFDVVRDEHLAELQAQIFLSGRLLAPFDQEWSDKIDALFPQFFYADRDHLVWGSIYRPVHAAIRAMFSIVSLDTMTNPVLAALSVILIVAVARRIWPDRPDAAVLAALLLATGPQFLFTGMSGFAWPAHLCLNLLWLWLYLRDDNLGHGLAALVGFAAVGLHQVNVHPLFVMPFMVSLMWARRWRLAAFYAVSYSAALLVWTNWHLIALHLSDVSPAAPSAAGVVLPSNVTHPLSLIGLATMLESPMMLFNFLRFLAWQNIIIIPLMFVALKRWTSAPPVIRLLAWGFVLSIIPYLLIMPNQFYAWGYRYVHALLGSFALIAVHGWIELTRESKQGAAMQRRAILAFSALVLVVGLPLRAVQMDALVGPLAAANRHIQSLATDVVLVDAGEVWFRNELIRNDPYLTGQPIVLSLLNLTPEQLREICERYSVTLFDRDDAAGFGVALADRRAAFADYDDSLHDIARGPECANSVR